MISAQVWRILLERISINTVKERSKEVVWVYTKDACLIPVGMGKYIQVQTSCHMKEEVLIEASVETIPVIILPDIVCNVKKKLGCIFVEKHNPEPILLKCRLTIGVVTSCVVTQEEKGQTHGGHIDATQSVR